MGSNDGRMKAAGGGRERKKEGFGFFHEDPTRYSLPYENDTLPFPSFPFYYSSRIKFVDHAERKNGRVPSAGISTLAPPFPRHFIGPSIINFRSGEISFLRRTVSSIQTPTFSYLEFYFLRSVTIYLVYKTCFPEEKERGREISCLEPSLFKISR